MVFSYLRPIKGSLSEKYNLRDVSGAMLSRVSQRKFLMVDSKGSCDIRIFFKNKKKKRSYVNVCTQRTP